MPNKTNTKKISKKKEWVDPLLAETVIKNLEELAACGKTCSADTPCYSCGGYSS